MVGHRHGLRAERRTGGVPQGRPRLRRGRDRPARRGLGPQPHVPGRHRARDGRARPLRPAVPARVRRQRRRLHDVLHRHRGARRASTQSMAITLEAGVGPRRQPDLPVRHRGAAPGVAARPVRRPAHSAASASPSPMPAATPAAPAPGDARRRDHEWVIDGEKAFITNSGTPITSIVTVTARTGPGEISAIVVPAGTPGLTVQPPYRKMGWHASDTHGLSFSGCRVPEANLLGERGRGFAQFLAILDDGRIAIAALAVGVVQACLEHSVALRREPQCVRQADRLEPGRRVPVRRPRGDGRRGAAAHLPGGVAEGSRAAVQARGRDREALRDRGGGHRDPRWRPRSSADTASWTRRR